MKKITFLSILILIGLFSSFISFGQNFYGTINNSTTCTVTVTIYDGGGGVLYTGNIGAGTTYVSTYNGGRYKRWRLRSYTLPTQNKGSWENELSQTTNQPSFIPAVRRMCICSPV